MNEQKLLELANEMREVLNNYMFSSDEHDLYNNDDVIEVIEKFDNFLKESVLCVK